MALPVEAIEISKVKQSKTAFQLKTLQKRDKKKFQLLENYFYENIQPIYGDQSKILEKIRLGQDRTCEFLIFFDRPVGVLVYKHQLSNEFRNFDIENGLELKTLFLLERKTKTAGVFLKALLGRAAQMALQKGAKNIFGTVSSKRPDVLKIMCKLGFDIIETFSGKYIEYVDEYLICHKSPLKLAREATIITMHINLE